MAVEFFDESERLEKLSKLGDPHVELKRYIEPLGQNSSYCANSMKGDACPVMQNGGLPFSFRSNPAVSVLTAKTQLNLNNASEYFQKHLAHGDYYSEINTVVGEWIG